MGMFISKLVGALSQLAALPHVRVCMVGLDAAGKTSILYKMKLGENVSTIPTIGFNVETVEYKGVNFTVWDVGGQDKIRALWRHYYADSDAVIFVVDSCDRTRLAEAAETLQNMLCEESLRGACLLVLANKQDLPQALKPAEVAAGLGLNAARNRQWFIQSTCATTGEGLCEGLDWLASAINKARRNKS